MWYCLGVKDAATEQLILAKVRSDLQNSVMYLRETLSPCVMFSFRGSININGELCECLAYIVDYTQLEQDCHEICVCIKKERESWRNAKSIFITFGSTTKFIGQHIILSYRSTNYYMSVS
jgi:hypothetical protein